jgi:glycosyltransferase involved in cell wall biosynthesis
MDQANKSPLISIITVCFNAASTIEETIKSVTEQSYNSREYIIIDGGSNDGTLDILEKYQDRITYMTSEPDNGIYDAMNKSLSHINGKYVYFIGADDVFYNNKSLENFINKVSVIKNAKRSIFYGNVIYKSQNKKYDGQFYDLKFCLRNICHQAVMYPSDVFKKYRFDLNYPYLADFVMNLTIKRDKVFDFYFIPEILAIYNDNGSSGSNIDSQFLKDRLKLIKGAFPVWIYIYAYVRFTIKKYFNG